MSCHDVSTCYDVSECHVVNCVMVYNKKINENIKPVQGADSWGIAWPQLSWASAKPSRWTSLESCDWQPWIVKGMITLDWTSLVQLSIVLIFCSWKETEDNVVSYLAKRTSCLLTSLGLPSPKKRRLKKSVFPSPSQNHRIKCNHTNTNAPKSPPAPTWAPKAGKSFGFWKSSFQTWQVGEEVHGDRVDPE